MIKHLLFTIYKGGRFIEATIEDLRGVNRSIPEGTTSYINTECPPEGLTINVCGKVGRIILFISRSTPTPPGAMYDKIIEVEEDQCASTYVACTSEEENGRKRRHPVSPEKTYEGVEETGYTGDTSTSKGILALCIYIIHIMCVLTHQVWYIFNALHISKQCFCCSVH